MREILAKINGVIDGNKYVFAIQSGNAGGKGFNGSMLVRTENHWQPRRIGFVRIDTAGQFRKIEFYLPVLYLDKAGQPILQRRQDEDGNLIDRWGFKASLEAMAETEFRLLLNKAGQPIYEKKAILWVRTRKSSGEISRRPFVSANIISDTAMIEALKYKIECAKTRVKFNNNELDKLYAEEMIFGNLFLRDQDLQFFEKEGFLPEGSTDT